MKTKNNKTYHSKEAVKQKIKQIGMVLSVITFIKLAFWIVVDAVAFKTLFQFIIRDDLTCLLLSGGVAICSSALIYILYRIEMISNSDSFDTVFRILKALCRGLIFFEVYIGIIVVLFSIPRIPFVMILAGALGIMPVFSYREATNMAFERLVYDYYAKYTIENETDE